VFASKSTYYKYIKQKTRRPTGCPASRLAIRAVSPLLYILNARIVSLMMMAGILFLSHFAHADMMTRGLLALGDQISDGWQGFFWFTPPPLRSIRRFDRRRLRKIHLSVCCEKSAFWCAAKKLALINWVTRITYMTEKSLANHIIIHKISTGYEMRTEKNFQAWRYAWQKSGVKNTKQKCVEFRAWMKLINKCAVT